MLIWSEDGTLLERAEQIFLIGGYVPPPPPPPPPLEPVLYLPFEDPDPLRDHTGNHNITLVAGDPNTSVGIINQAYSFDGDDYLQTSLDFNNFTQLSIDYYVNFDQVLTSRPMTTEGAYWSGVTFNTAQNGTLQFFIRNNEISEDSFGIPGQLVCMVDNPLVLQANQWYRVVGIWDGFACTLSVAGITKTAQNQPNASAYIKPGFLDLGSGNTPTNHLKGSLDEVLVYDTVIPLPECDNDGVCEGNESLATCINDCMMPGAILYYDFEDPNPLEDKAGDNDATPMGDPGPTTGNVSQGYAFDGDDYLQTPLWVNNFDEVTFDLYVNFDEIRPGEHVFTGKYGGYGLALSDGKFDFGLRNERNEQFCRIRSDVKAQIGKWHHVVGAWDGEECYLVVDGELKTQTVSDITGGLKSGNLNLGYHVSSTQYYLHGSLDEVRVFDTAQFTYYIDNDGDGYGNPDGPTITQPANETWPGGYVLDNTDPDDNNANIPVGAGPAPGEGLESVPGAVPSLEFNLFAVLCLLSTVFFVARKRD